MGIQLKSLKPAINNFMSDVSSDLESFVSNLAQQIPSIFEQVSNFAIDFALDKLKSYIDKIDKTLFGYVQAYDRLLKQFGGFDLLLSSFSYHTECKLSLDFLYDPHISGYFYFIFTPPKCLSRYIPKQTNKFIGFLAIDIGNSTPQIETAQNIGVGRNINVIPTSRTVDHSLTATFYDVYNLTVTQFFHRWQDCIIDPRYGLHMYKSIDEFKTNAIVIHQDSTHKVLMDIYLGLYPTSVPTLEQSKTNVTLVQKSITFAYDKVIPSQSI